MTMLHLLALKSGETIDIIGVNHVIADLISTRFTLKNRLIQVPYIAGNPAIRQTILTARKRIIPIRILKSI